MPRLLRVLRWVERFSPPKVLPTFVPDSQPKRPITFAEKKDMGKGSRDANQHPNVVRIVRKMQRVPLMEVALQ